MGKVARERMRARATDLFRAHATLESAAHEERAHLGAIGWSESLMRVSEWLKKQAVELDAKANQEAAQQTSDQRPTASGVVGAASDTGSSGRQTVLIEDDGA